MIRLAPFDLDDTLIPARDGGIACARITGAIAAAPDVANSAASGEMPSFRQ